ncbi:MAG: endonuclease/exonuclease/phosphatase family protein, partial [Planctomycetota bacterium]
FGLALFSREPFDDIRVFQATPNIDSIEVTWNGIQVIATHPLPPMGANRFHMRNRHFQEVASRVSQFSARMPKVPVIVMGDFNLTPWSPWMRKFETASKLSRVASGIGLTPTWYARPNRFLSGLVLDHVLVSDHLNCTDYNVGGDIGSDHRGVIVRLQRSDD